MGQTDLLGKVIREPMEPAPPFYCYGCGATYSAKCKKCGTRFCGNRRRGREVYCYEAVCPKCDAGKTLTAKPGAEGAAIAPGCGDGVGNG